MKGFALAIFIAIQLGSGLSFAKTIRIMPLGDSLTAGGYNIDKTWYVDGGYREHLYNMLNKTHRDFVFVGPLSHGSFANSDHAGYSGWKIHEVAAKLPELLPEYKPDVVLLILGSNDLFRNFEIEKAPQRLAEMIQQIVGENPNIKLFVGSVLTAENFILNRRVKGYNKRIKKIVRELEQQNPNIHWVDMYRESNIKGNSRDLTDGVHPTVLGYRKMAAVWYRVLNVSNVFVNP